MMRNLRAVAAAGGLLISVSGGGTASAQKRGDILRMYSIDSPAKMSILEESTVFAEGPMTSLFNNLCRLGTRRFPFCWTNDNFNIPRKPDPTMLEALNDRAKDNYNMVLAIADAAGDDWAVPVR